MNKTLENKYNSRVIMYNNILIEVGFMGLYYNMYLLKVNSFLFVQRNISNIFFFLFRLLLLKA